MTDYTKLKALAAAATPGPWCVTQDKSGVWCVASPDEDMPAHPWLIAEASTYAPGKDDTGEANAAFIAAASPSVIASLVADLEREREKCRLIHDRIASFGTYFREAPEGADVGAHAIADLMWLHRAIVEAP